MRTRTRVGVVAALATVLVGATSTVAYADTYNYWCETAGNDAGGRNCVVAFYNGGGTNVGDADFKAYGEVIYLRDYVADGRGVFASAAWYDGGNRYAEHWLTAGANTIYELNLSIPEGTHVTFTVCQTNDGYLLNCVDQTAIA